jgi:beta-galactosidase
LIGRHEGGYNGFRYDITDVANCGGRNVISVHVDASHFEGWFYEGAGIYRHVWLVKTAPVAIAQDGVFVRSVFADNVPGPTAKIVMQARVQNSSGAPSDARLSFEIIAPGGATVATATADGHAEAGGHGDVEQSAEVRGPELWSPETPALYTLVTTLSVGGKPVDRVSTAFGIRTVGFDANLGYILNGHPYTLKGTCNHQDHAGLGSALPDAVQYFRIARLKEMGSNAYRTAHNPPTPELLDACDRLGMIVMDENRILGSDPTHIAYLEEQIKRDRNHPSVGLWSIGNEEFAVQMTQEGKRVAATMQALVKRLDPSRPVTENVDRGNEFSGVNEVIEVRGWSYHVGPGMDGYHKEHPTQPNVGSEQGSTVGTRGIFADDKAKGYVSSYDDFAPEWAQTAETWMSIFGTRPWMSGGFVWTGFDYRGEPTPYGWPCINSHFGIMDTCGFPKENFWYYQAWWSGHTVLHLTPHWNWAGREGQPIDVRAMTNCEEVEVFLNGKSQGRKTVTAYIQPRWSVPYSPGTLSAKGYNGGKLVAEAAWRQPERRRRSSSSRTARSSRPTAGTRPCSRSRSSTARAARSRSRTTRFHSRSTVPGRILGVGNGDPSSHEPDTFIVLPEVRRAPISAWRGHAVKDPYPEKLPEELPGFDDSSWPALDVAADQGTLGFHDKVVYRGHFDITEADLEAPAIQVSFGKLGGGIAVYVNGEKVGGTSDRRSPSAYDVKAHLHPGDNVIAVSAANYGPDPMGISNGVSLLFQGRTPAAAWSRSAFNGLAEVIVQSSATPGEVRLAARAEGLADGSFVLASRAP